jgi:hypothetical protein
VPCRRVAPRRRVVASRVSRPSHCPSSTVARPSLKNDSRLWQKSPPLRNQIQNQVGVAERAKEEEKKSFTALTLSPQQRAAARIGTYRDVDKGGRTDRYIPRGSA